MRTGLTLLLVLAFVTVAGGQTSSVSLTVYNRDLALVREIRSLTLRKGIQDYAYDGVTARIDPTSVRFEADGVTVLEQNFEYDLVDRAALLEKYVGETIDVITGEEVLRGRLLSNSGGIILEDDDGNVRIVEHSVVHSLRFPELPAGLILKPTLRWTLDARHTGSVSGDLTYLTGGLSWEASYVALVIGEGEVELGGWVQVKNRSGANFVDAKLKLIAGDVRLVRDRMRMREPRLQAAGSKMAGGFEQKELFEYHLYTLPRPVTLHDNQSKQISLIEPRLVKASRSYLYDGAFQGSDVAVHMKLLNDRKSGLGMPLPAGKIRLFQRDDSDGSPQFIGEDLIDHTPEGEPVELIVGNAFDIVGERTRTEFKRLGDRGRDESWKIEIRNRKSEAVTVTVLEHLGGDWKILDESSEGYSENAMIRTWDVDVPAKSTSSVTYRVRFN